MKSIFMFAMALINIIFSYCTKPAIENNTSGVRSGNKNAVVTYSDFGEYDYKGVNWAPYGDYWQSPSLEDDITNIKDAGINWVRVWFRSDSSLASLDSLVSKCNRSGAKILAVYKKSNPRTDLGSASQQALDTALLRTLVNRYKTSIHYWEVHNEPNLNGYWNLGGTATDTTEGSAYSNGVKNYVSWLRLAYTTIKAADSSATVVMGGLSSWVMQPFMYRLTREHAYDYFDETAFHPYADDPDKVVQQLLYFKKEMASWPNPNMPVWITEIGFHTGTSSSGHVGVPDEATKASYLKTLYEKMAQNLYTIRPVFWYILHEEQYNSEFFGLTNRTSSTSQTIYYDPYFTYKNLTQSWSYLQGTGSTIVQQAEHLTIENNTKPVSVFYDANCSNQNGSKFNSNAINDSVTYIVPNVPPGTYNIRVGVKTSNARGQFQLYAYKTGNYSSGSNIGGLQDLYSASDAYTELNIANWTVGSESDKSFRFKIKGKNTASTDYTLAIDYIKLIPL